MSNQEQLANAYPFLDSNGRIGWSKSMMNTGRLYHYTFRWDGDYIDLLVLRAGLWVSVTQWLIPGTQMED